MSTSMEMVRANGASLSPAELVERDIAVADALDQLVKNKGLVKQIGNKPYLTAEAWSAAGRILGTSVEIDDPEPFTDSKGGKGYRARAVVRDRDGNLIASATAVCTRSESAWANRDEYALYSMAQTRASGKAHRTGLSAIAVMAGYEPTPAEEMPEPATPPAAAAKPSWDDHLKNLTAKAKALGLSENDIRGAVESVTGKRSLRSVTPENAREVWAQIEAVAKRDPIADGSADSEAEDVPDGELDFGAES